MFVYIVKGGIIIDTLDELLRETAHYFKMLGRNNFSPEVKQSHNWVEWETHFGPRTCFFCSKQHGKLFPFGDFPTVSPAHEYCNCITFPILSISAGSATIDKANGADYWIAYFGCLPPNYVTKEAAFKIGWQKRKGNLSQISDNLVIGGNVYNNISKKLPSKNGRIWYEADINYIDGYRNAHRLLYSNDGLIFVTYNHYDTFYEIEV